MLGTRENKHSLCLDLVQRFGSVFSATKLRVRVLFLIFKFVFFIFFFFFFNNFLHLFLLHAGFMNFLDAGRLGQFSGIQCNSSLCSFRVSGCVGNCYFRFFFTL